MKKIIALLLVLIMVLSLAACSDFPKSEADLNESQVPEKYKTSQLKTKEAGEEQNNLYYDMNLIISVMYPQFSSASLNEIVINTVNDLRSQFAETANGFTAERFRKRGTFFVDYETFKKDDLISVVFYTNVENMGENALDENVKTIVFDTKSGREITASSYFRASANSLINEKAQPVLEKAAKSQGAKDYAFSNLDSFNKFAVKADGVEFYFSKNDVFAGTEHISFNIPESEIKDEVIYGTIDPNRPMVAVTFDDGPGAYTGRVLDIMEKYGVRCTFFMVGENLAESKADLLKRAVSLGCQIGSHSRHHAQLSKKSATDAADDVEYVANEIKKLTGGYKVTSYRPPYGSYTKAMVEELSSRGYKGYNWSVDTLDWKNKDSSWVLSQATGSYIHDGDIILMHDIHKTTVDALEDIVKSLLADGYQLVTANELSEIRGVECTTKPILECYKK